MEGAVRGPSCKNDENAPKPDSLRKTARAGTREKVEAEDTELRLNKARQLYSTRQEKQ